MIDAGKLRHRITFQRFDGQRDEYGDPLKGDDEHWSEVTHKVSCRYRSGLDTAMRIVCRGRVFQIISIIDWEERHESLLIMCKELVK